LKAVHPDLAPIKPAKPSAEAPPKEEGWFNLRSAAGMVFKLPSLGRARKENKAGPSVPIRGPAANLAVNFAPEGAVPGDRIVGIIQPGKGIVIYPIHSPALAAFDDEPDRWVDVRWETEEQPDARYPARVSVTAINVPGSLAAIASLVARHDANIDTLTMRSTAPDFTEMELNLQVRDVRQLNGLVTELKALDCVSAATRALG
jgi:GTP diphosphokinase / guanosine-3',5'-bis(diphosphate) 3'-diphosphatase